MRTKLTFFTALLGATAAVAILAAPVASAAAGKSCFASESANVCRSPGNTQINDATPQSQLPSLRRLRIRARRRPINDGCTLGADRVPPAGMS